MCVRACMCEVEDTVAFIGKCDAFLVNEVISFDVMKQPVGGRQQRGLRAPHRPHSTAAGMDVCHAQRILYKLIISLPKAPRPHLFMIFDCQKHIVPQIRYTV